MPRRFRVALVIEGLVAIALLIDLVARIPAHRRQGDLTAHIVGVLACLILVVGLIVWTERRSARPPGPRRAELDPALVPMSPERAPARHKQVADDGKPAPGGAYDVTDGRWTSNLPGSRGASYDWSRGRKEPGSRWGRIVSWTDPATGTQFYTLGAKYFGPTGYMVLGLIGLGVGVFIVGMVITQASGVKLTLIALLAAVVPFGLAYLSFMCGFNLRRYDRKHHYRFLYEGDVARLRRQLAAGEPFDRALLRARLIGGIWAWVVLALAVGYVAYRQATGW